jgi:hypothetical protein
MKEQSASEDHPRPYRTTLIELLETLYPSYSSWLKTIEESEQEMNRWAGTTRRQAMEESLRQWQKDDRPEISWPECRRLLEISEAQHKQIRADVPCDVLSPNDRTERQPPTETVARKEDPQ